MQDVDVFIDFTKPDAVVENIRNISKFGKNIVVGTTGWNDKINDVKEIVKKNNVGLIYASNFSIGVNVFFKIIGNAAKIMDKLDDYDVFGYELHHNEKLDSPSGTAKSIEKILVKNISRKKSVPFASVRSGNIPGTHVIGFDSSADTIELKHTARNREGFASGAVMAAQWIKGKKGFYSIDDMMNEVLGGN
jgi:4-hydroxy-tetrahydrodipicolinate reductase